MEKESCKRYLEAAESAGKAIADPEDRSIFTGDLEGSEWYSLR
jgi:hypothetical protein